MVFGTALIMGALCIAAAAQDTPTAPPRSSEVGVSEQSRGRDGAGVAADPEVSVRERTAQSSARIDSPQGLFDIKQTIEQSFGVKLSIEPLPEQCKGAEDPGLSIEPFTINVGELFGEVIARLEEASQGRWIFDEIHGIPLLRPKNLLDGHGTLLDTVVTVDIKASSMWDALCALARAVNRANGVHTRGGRPLIISFVAPSLLRHPPPEFIEKKSLVVSVDRAPAREGLCAIFAQVEDKFRITYSYTCVAEGRQPDYDYISIEAFDNEGRVVNGGKMSGEDYQRLAKTVDWMSTENILAVQAPLPGDAAAPITKDK